MVNFVIYEKDRVLREHYVKIIDKFFFSKFDHYKIHKFDEYNLKVQNQIREIEGTRIFILNIDSPDFVGCKLAKDLRVDGDLISPVILMTNAEIDVFDERLRYILYLDLIHINKRMIFSLMRSLRDAYKIVTRHSVYTFDICDEIYRLPYDDIYFIEKNHYNNSVTIYTKDDSYLYYITINRVEDALKSDPRFLKVHRSCILNIYNVLSYDKKTNTVFFNNGMCTNMISKCMREKLIERLYSFESKQPDDE